MINTENQAPDGMTNPVTPSQSFSNPDIEKHKQIITEGKAQGSLGTLLAYTKLSGPGWIQSAITLGGGSLSSALYLGIIAGFAFMWVQPLAMILGVIMLSAIAYVTLSTGKSPFKAINEHISPVLGWGWLLASMAANMVWSMPQFSLATAAVQQNLLPQFLGEGGIPEPWSKIIIVGTTLAVAATVVMLYSRGGWGVKAFDWTMKTMVGGIVLCFFAVVIRMSISGEVAWNKIFLGLIPSWSSLSEPTASFSPFLADLTAEGRAYWSGLIVDQQRSIIISAAAAAVGINMTFLLPYSMLKKGWSKEFKGLAVFDLSTGLFIPFVIATACVVIVSASQFHAKIPAGLENSQNNLELQVPKTLQSGYQKNLEGRLKSQLGGEAFANLSDNDIIQQISKMPVAEKRMAAMLVKRDAFQLSNALTPITGPTLAHYIFGLGIFGMALSTAIVLMTINGFCLCEALNKPGNKHYFRIGVFMVFIGAIGPFAWNQAKLWLAIPTSVFGMVLLPIAYIAFFLLMNQKTLLGKQTPQGKMKFVWNGAMFVATLVAGGSSLWVLWSKLQFTGIFIFAAFFLAVLIGSKLKKRNSPSATVHETG
ncbi:MAG: divalent metal cation transporter [Verrucomicrobiota bacterium]